MKFLLLLFALLSACVTPAPKTPPPLTPPVITKYPTVGWQPAYDVLIFAKVTQPMVDLPAARMRKFCPVWQTMPPNQRKTFYTDLLYSIASPESGYNNLSMYIESSQGKDELTGLAVASEGLLQLSYQDKKGYPECDFDAKKDLAALADDMKGHTKGGFNSHHPERDTLNPVKNLSCGVVIVDKLLRIHEGEEFATTLGRYWSTMRNGYPKVLAKMKERKSPCVQ